MDDSRVRRDPRKLAYLFPSMPVGRFKNAVDAYYKDITLKTIEDVARMAGMVVVPASCIHHQNRKAARRVHVIGRAYYILKIDELTLTERMRYRDACGGVGGQ